MRDAHSSLRLTEKREQGSNALQAEGEAAAPLEFVADLWEGVLRA